MKVLKFVPSLCDLILKNKKTTSWRFFDEKNIVVGDELVLRNSKTKKDFALARVVSVKEKVFKSIDEEDKDGHEKFNSDEEMLKTYIKYYGDRVGKDTLVKVIKFVLLKKI